MHKNEAEHVPTISSCLLYTGALPAKYVEDIVELSPETLDVGISIKLFTKSSYIQIIRQLLMFFALFPFDLATKSFSLYDSADGSFQ